MGSDRVLPVGSLVSTPYGPGIVVRSIVTTDEVLVDIRYDVRYNNGNKKTVRTVKAPHVQKRTT